MKSLVIKGSVLILVGVTCIVTGLLVRFARLPADTSKKTPAFVALSPYEWLRLEKLEPSFATDFSIRNVPDLYSGIRLKAASRLEHYDAALEAMRRWMIADLSRDPRELALALTGAPIKQLPKDFRAVLAAGFGGTSDDCSAIKLERAFRIRSLSVSMQVPAVDYLRKCKVPAGVVLLAEIDYKMKFGFAGREEAALAAKELEALRTEATSSPLIASVLKSNAALLERLSQ